MTPQDDKFESADAENKQEAPELIPANANQAEIDAETPGIPAQRYDLKILQALRQIMRAIDLHSRKLRASHDITGPQLVCLTTIVEHGPLTVKQIAEHVFLSPSTVVGILDRLEAKKLILRLRDTQDRRAVNVTATPTGTGLADQAPSPLQDGLASSLQNLSEIEQTAIALSLQRVVDLMEAGGIEAAPILETGQLVSGESADGTSVENEKQNE